MSEIRYDPKQVAAFRALARRISDSHSQQRFEEAVRRLITLIDNPDGAESALPEPEAAAKASAA